MKKLILCVALATAMAAAFAQAAPGEQERASAAQQKLAALHWLEPGSVGRVAGKADYKVTEGFTFLDAADTDKFLELNGNMPQGDSYTVAPVKGSWFGILSFAPEGYIKDDEKIDADDLLETLQEQNTRGNEQRKKAGYPTMILEGWYFPPRYDTENKRLEWGTKLRNEDQTVTVNVSTKILGRSGYTSAILVTDPETVDKDLLDFKRALKNFDYVSGEKYSEWKKGDKVAAYGLGALVVGGAAAAAASKGGFKAIGIAFMAGLAALWAGVKRMFGRKS